MRNDIARTNLLTDTRNRCSITFRDWLVVRWRGKSRAVGWTYGQILQKALGGSKFFFRQSIDQVVQSVAVHSATLIHHISGNHFPTKCCQSFSFSTQKNCISSVSAASV